MKALFAALAALAGLGLRECAASYRFTVLRIAAVVQYVCGARRNLAASLLVVSCHCRHLLR